MRSDSLFIPDFEVSYSNVGEAKNPLVNYVCVSSEYNQELVLVYFHAIHL